MSANPESPVARTAASVLLIRDDPFEVLMIRRNSGLAFSDALVFPGGTVDPEDHDEGWSDLVKLADHAIEERPLRIAAMRETFEECGLFLASDSDGAYVAQPGAGGDFRMLVAQSGGALSLDALAHFGHWVTPNTARKRFDTHFFLARAPRDQQPRHDGAETVALEWVQPAVALERAASDEVSLLFPTLMNIKRLAESNDCQTAFAAALARPRFTVQPEAEVTAEGTLLRIPEEAGYGQTEFLKIGPVV